MYNIRGGETRKIWRGRCDESWLIDGDGGVAEEQSRWAHGILIFGLLFSLLPLPRFPHPWHDLADDPLCPSPRPRLPDGSCRRTLFTHAYLMNNNNHNKRTANHRLAFSPPTNGQSLVLATTGGRRIFSQTGVISFIVKFF